MGDVLVVPTDKLEILAPYLALAGLIAIVSAVVVVKRRGDWPLSSPFTPWTCAGPKSVLPI
jgi:hypothetical protein